MLYDVDIEASACVLSSRYAMLCYAKTNMAAVVMFGSMSEVASFYLLQLHSHLGLTHSFGMTPVEFCDKPDLNADYPIPQ